MSKSQKPGPNRPDSGLKEDIEILPRIVRVGTLKRTKSSGPRPMRRNKGLRKRKGRPGNPEERNLRPTKQKRTSSTKGCP